MFRVCGCRLGCESIASIGEAVLFETGCFENSFNVIIYVKMKCFTFLELLILTIVKCLFLIGNHY